jgi:hypothetical protein
VVAVAGVLGMIAHQLISARFVQINNPHCRSGYTTAAAITAITHQPPAYASRPLPSKVIPPTAQYKIHNKKYTTLNPDKHSMDVEKTNIIEMTSRIMREKSEN